MIKYGVTERCLALVVNLKVGLRLCKNVDRCFERLIEVILVQLECQRMTAR